MYYPNHPQLPSQEDGSFDYHHDSIFSEIMSRRRIASFYKYGIHHMAGSSIDKHLLKSKLFNTKLFVSVPRNKFPYILSSAMYEHTLKTNKPATLPIRIVSDGKKAYVRFEKESN